MSLLGLTIFFEGWFQCRLATDPDPTDEPRGVSGSTFALGEEPDLDRVIRFQTPPPGTLRSHGPEIAVNVVRAEFIGQEAPWIAGANVDLLGEPKLENRNFVLTVAGREPILPFDLELAGDGFRLRRSIAVPGLRGGSPVEIPRAVLERFGARGFRVGGDQVLAAAGIPDPKQNRIERQEHLKRDLEREEDPLIQAGLRKRIAELDRAISNPKDERIVAMRAIEEFTFELTGPAELEGEKLLQLRLDGRAPWVINFWMGCWDADAMSGFTKGSLQIPVASKVE